MLVGSALLFAALALGPRPWHFGIRATRLWPTLGWAVLAFVLLLGFELGYVALLGVEESNVDELGTDSTVAALGSPWL